MNTDQHRFGFAFLIYLCSSASICGSILLADEPTVTTLRVPNAGIQPQAAVDDKGAVHLIYYKGDPMAGDVFFAKSHDGEKFSDPIRVNSKPGSAVAAGTMRGPHMALGRNGRVHVAWNGAHKAKPRAPGDQPPMLYTRLNDDATAFEPQRNVMLNSAHLDGGGSVAADRDGRVYVVWHANARGEQPSEQSRRIFLARSDDDGKTFTPDAPLDAKPLGACACCGLRAATDGDGALHILYRSARTPTDRDMQWLVSHDQGRTFPPPITVDLLSLNYCPASTCSITATKDGVLLAWEATPHQARFLSLTSSPAADAIQPPQPSRHNRKHPLAVQNAHGQTLLAWVETHGFGQGGQLAWQVFDADGKPIEPDAGQADGVPKWSFPAAFAKPDGSFVVIY